MKLPIADGQTGLAVLRELARERHLLAAMAAMRQRVGRVFQITLPRFNPAVFVGPEASREIMVTGRDQFSWRTESDPVCKLLRRGVLVVDGEEHDQYRALMAPPLYRRESLKHLEMMWQQTDRIMANWANGEPVDMLVEMRKVALLILVEALFGVDFMPDMARMWQPILRSDQLYLTWYVDCVAQAATLGLWQGYQTDGCVFVWGDWGKKKEIKRLGDWEIS